MKEFKPILFFLLRLGVTAVILLILYNLYLNQFLDKNIPDWYTKKVADWSVVIMNWFTDGAKTVPMKDYPGVWIQFNSQYLTYVNEGCNAVSIIIIFVSFVAGFYTKFWQTFFFIFFGIISIVIFNLIRIVGINFLVFQYPEYQKIAHDYVFPALIYGFIVLLWVLWIRFFVMKSDTNE